MSGNRRVALRVQAAYPQATKGPVPERPGCFAGLPGNRRRKDKGLWDDFLSPVRGLKQEK